MSRGGADGEPSGKTRSFPFLEHFRFSLDRPMALGLGFPAHRGGFMRGCGCLRRRLDRAA